MSAWCTAAAKKIKQMLEIIMKEMKNEKNINIRQKYQCRVFIYLEYGRQFCFHHFKYDVIELEKVKGSKDALE